MSFHRTRAAASAAFAESKSAWRSLLTPRAGVGTRTAESTLPERDTTPAAILVPPKSTPNTRVRFMRTVRCGGLYGTSVGILSADFADFTDCLVGGLCLVGGFVSVLA